MCYDKLFPGALSFGQVLRDYEQGAGSADARDRIGEGRRQDVLASFRQVEHVLFSESSSSIHREMINFPAASLRFIRTMIILSSRPRAHEMRSNDRSSLTTSTTVHEERRQEKEEVRPSGALKKRNQKRKNTECTKGRSREEDNDSHKSLMVMA